MVREPAWLAERWRGEWGRRRVHGTLTVPLGCAVGRGSSVRSRLQRTRVPSLGLLATSRVAPMLDARSRMLYLGRAFFMNGERLEVERAIQVLLQHLADRRYLPATDLDEVFTSLLYEWYRAGYLWPKK